MAQVFQPVWLSTVAHMDEHARIAGSASFLQKQLGTFDCPEDFPQLQLMWGILFYTKIPLVYCQYGKLSVGQRTLEFESQTPRTFGSKIRGHFPDLNFQLNPDQIKSVVEYTYPNPYMSWANLNWVRIRTTEDILGGDFLMSMTGYWPNTIRQQTSNLLSAVQAAMTP